MTANEARVGVYVCHCGGNISDYVDVKKVAETLKEEPGVVVSRDVMFACSDSTQNEMIADIKENKLDRIVVASCSPRLHELTFRNVAERAGLNRYTYCHANIREQSSWAHTDDKKGATIKSIRHTRAAVAYAKLAEPLESIRAPVTSAVLIVGGGVAGLRAAIDLADTGLSVHLVEREPCLGGRVAQLAKVFPQGKSGAEVARDLIDEVRKRSTIAVYTNTQISGVDGYIGNFEVKLTVKPRSFKASTPEMEIAPQTCGDQVSVSLNHGLTERVPLPTPAYPIAQPEALHLDLEAHTSSGLNAAVQNDVTILDSDQKSETIRIKVGSIIVATGFDPYEPKIGEYGYGVLPNVVTLPQFHVLLESGLTEKVRDIAFIYCVGSREIPSAEKAEVNEYCSRYCCNAAMSTSLYLLDKVGGAHLYHLYRDIRTYGKNETLYQDASKKGILFFKFARENPPKVSAEDGRLTVRVKDLLTPVEEEIEMTADMVVLVTGMVPRKDDESLYRMLKVSVGKDKFLLEIHPKLKPVETAIGGIFLAGCAQGPKNTREALTSAEAASSKAASILLKNELQLEPSTVQVNPELCALNKLCLAECKYDAIEIVAIQGLGKRARVNEARCKGCGACVAVCPTGAIQLKTLRNDEALAVIAALGEKVEA